MVKTMFRCDKNKKLFESMNCLKAKNCVESMIRIGLLQLESRGKLSHASSTAQSITPNTVPHPSRLPLFISNYIDGRYTRPFVPGMLLERNHFQIVSAMTTSTVQ